MTHRHFGKRKGRAWKGRGVAGGVDPSGASKAFGSSAPQCRVGEMVQSSGIWRSPHLQAAPNQRNVLLRPPSSFPTETIPVLSPGNTSHITSPSTTHKKLKQSRRCHRHLPHSLSIYRLRTSSGRHSQIRTTFAIRIWKWHMKVTQAVILPAVRHKRPVTFSSSCVNPSSLTCFCPWTSHSSLRLAFQVSLLR